MIVKEKHSFHSFVFLSCLVRPHQSVFRSSPLLGCFLFGLPLGVISLMCYGICTAETDDGSDEAGKREGLTDEEEDEEDEEEERHRANELEGPEEDEDDDDEEEEEEEDDVGEKDPEEKKTD